MMTVDERALFQLYQDIIMDHHESPRNFGELATPDGKQEGFNPMCGDRVVVEVKLDKLGSEKKIKDIRFTGEGCSICLASASIMTEEVSGKSSQEVSGIIDNFRGLMTGAHSPESLKSEELKALSGVRRFPVRIKCALLPWITLRDAMKIADAPSDQTIIKTTTEGTG